MMMFPLKKSTLRSAFMRAGLFPFARSMYRTFSRDIKDRATREIAFYSDFIPKGGLCFDIGANLGQKTEIFLKAGASKVICVEPNPACNDALEYQFSSDERVELVKNAVGPESGLITLFTHGADSTASVRPEWDKMVWGTQRETHAIKVPMTTLDELIKKYGRPDFLKIDVEGYERDVISGLSESIAAVSLEWRKREIDLAAECLRILAARYLNCSFSIVNEDLSVTETFSTQEDCLEAMRLAKYDYGDVIVSHVVNIAGQ